MRLSLVLMYLFSNVLIFGAEPENLNPYQSPDTPPPACSKMMIAGAILDAQALLIKEMPNIPDSALTIYNGAVNKVETNFAIINASGLSPEADAHFQELTRWWKVYEGLRKPFTTPQRICVAAGCALILTAAISPVLTALEYLFPQNIDRTQYIPVKYDALLVAYGVGFLLVLGNAYIHLHLRAHFLAQKAPYHILYLTKRSEVETAEAWLLKNNFVRTDRPQN